MHEPHRILRLDLCTSAPIDVMARFYGGALGLAVEREGDDALRARAGATTLAFTRKAGGAQYHFAFNIPENLIRAAHDWLSTRVAVLPNPVETTDPPLPVGVRRFPSWNAHSVYFRDPAGNVVEFIARHDLGNARGSGEEFGPADVLYASEIAFASDDADATAALLCERLGLGAYKGGDSEFRAVGDERGLLLVFRTGRVMIGDVASRAFPTTVTVHAGVEDRFTLPGEPGHVIVAMRRAR